MSDSMAQMHQGGQQPVDEHRPMPGAGADRALARPIGQSRVPARAPSATSSARTSRDSPVTWRSATAAARAGLGSSTHHDPAALLTSAPSR